MKSVNLIEDVNKNIFNNILKLGPLTTNCVLLPQPLCDSCQDCQRQSELLIK